MSHNRLVAFECVRDGVPMSFVLFWEVLLPLVRGGVPSLLKSTVRFRGVLDSLLFLRDDFDPRDDTFPSAVIFRGASDSNVFLSAI